MNRYPLAAFLVLLSGCNPRYQMSDAARAASDAYAACLKRQAAALDDGVSDVASLGIAVDASCSRERHAMTEEMSAGQSMAFHNRLYQRMESENWKLATAAVAAHRKGP